jgi:hypothetical protein
MINITPSFSGRELSRMKELKQYMSNIQNLVSCPARIYKKLYRETLRNFMEFCQAMPYSQIEFNHAYGFSTRQLKLVIATLMLRRGILLPKNVATENIVAEEAQWTYAIFAASLVRNLYQLQVNREINRYKLHGDLIGKWYPMTESLYKTSSYYSMIFSSQNSVVNADIFMAAVSEHIFPHVAIKWLSSNQNLFKQWWECVLHQTSAENEIESIIQLAGEKSGIGL